MNRKRTNIHCSGAYFPHFNQNDFPFSLKQKDLALDYDELLTDLNGKSSNLGVICVCELLLKCVFIW